MSTLHTVNKSPFTNNALSSCLKVCAQHDAILLIEDGTYGALLSSPLTGEFAALARNGITIYALTADVKARGLAEKMMQGVQLADYDCFVQLTIEHDRVQSWY